MIQVTEYHIKGNNKKQYRYMLFLSMFVLLFSLCVGCGKQKEGEQIEQVAVTCVDDLPGKNIGVQIGTTGDIYASDYKNDDAGTQITRFNKGADAVQALKQNKVDCVIIDEQPANAFVGKNKELTILEEEFAIEDYAICIAKGNTELKD